MRKSRIVFPTPSILLTDPQMTICIIASFSLCTYLGINLTHIPRPWFPAVVFCFGLGNMYVYLNLDMTNNADMVQISSYQCCPRNTTGDASTSAHRECAGRGWSPVACRCFPKSCPVIFLLSTRQSLGRRLLRLCSSHTSFRFCIPPHILCRCFECGRPENGAFRFPGSRGSQPKDQKDPTGAPNLARCVTRRYFTAEHTICW
jgi:hypothetical protein